MYEEENWDDPTPTPVSKPQPSIESKTFVRQRNDYRSGYSFNNSDHNREYKRSYNKHSRDENYSRQRNDKYENNYGNKTTVMTVESKNVAKIIGRQGSKIKELEQKTGTKIKIRSNSQEDDFQKVIISGLEEGRHECKKLIEELTAVLLKSSILTSALNIQDAEAKDNIPIIDWDKVNALSDEAEAKKWVNCPPIKKDFYIEDPEVANMSKKEVEEFRKTHNNIVVNSVFGGNAKVLNPVKTFAQAFKNFPEIMREIEKQGFTEPSPIQCQAWPVLLSGGDLIGIAQTGTGKTLAFLLPALIHIDGQEVPRSERGGANVLIIAPTRELALQIEKEVQKYSYREIKSVCVYGGTKRKEQIQTITHGVEIIIATPGRLNDLVEAGVIDVSSITYLVLDEADRMLDLGFEPQIRKVLLDIRPDRQNVMTSATWPSKVQTLAERYMNNPVQVYIGSLDLAAVHSVTQTVVVIDEMDKKDYLFNFINNLTDEDKVIVFVSKKVNADQLSCDLSLERIMCQCIHGNREQIDREQALEDLKTGKVRILIATDVASRGIDISDITKVFNYDFPKNIEEYVHRVGRTGRAGKKGEAITLFTRRDWNFAGELIKIMEEANQPIPKELHEMNERFIRMLEKRKQEPRYGGDYSSDRRGRKPARHFFD